ncbi:MAG TPA: hypothetical protein DEB39_11230, partial [Planctomycetaceae bacterium]|nr:hypothetical protein [Planctomycetaceae bacterium]
MAALLTFLAAGVSDAQIPERVSFQPSSYGGGGAPANVPYYWQPYHVQPYHVQLSYGQVSPLFIAQPLPQPDKQVAGQVAGAADRQADSTSEVQGKEGLANSGDRSQRDQSRGNGADFGNAWQERFPATPDVPSVPVPAQPGMIETVAPIPYLAYHTTRDGRTHVVPYGPAYLFAPEQLPQRTSHWKRFWASSPSSKQDVPQVPFLSYYTPMPTVIESEPDWWKRTLGYPRPIWGPMPAASWIGGLPAASLAKVTMHFYEGSQAGDYVWQQQEALRKAQEQDGQPPRAHHLSQPREKCPIHGDQCPHQNDSRAKGEAARHPHHGHARQAVPTTSPKPRPDVHSNVIIDSNAAPARARQPGAAVLETEDIESEDVQPAEETVAEGAEESVKESVEEPVDAVPVAKPEEEKNGDPVAPIVAEPQETAVEPEPMTEETVDEPADSAEEESGPFGEESPAETATESAEPTDEPAGPVEEESDPVGGESPAETAT